MHLTTLWMITKFTTENGATLIVPGSPRKSTNPTADTGGGPQPINPFDNEPPPGGRPDRYS
ncbi:MAG: hypothetical protein Ct9H300mP1_19080 [Planctomycetaceae bacterium]|nr:MAG: hypothetical protein Ct9H300mP1_19080 [Planctomycetaceae bacterium]